MLTKSVFMIAALAVMSICPASAGTKWGICKAENGCPWSHSENYQTVWIGCGDVNETAKDYCSIIDENGGRKYGRRTLLISVRGPFENGKEKCVSKCGCAEYVFTCLDY